MYYSTEGKKRIAALFNAFHDYIANHWAIDVMYSPRLGFIYIAGIDERDACIIETAKGLFELLADDIMMDVAFAKENELLTEDALSQEEREEIRRRVGGILATMREGREEYMNLLEDMMGQFNRNALDD